MTPLQKSVRIYRALVERLPPLTPEALRGPEYREACNYLRALYREFGQAAVKAERGRL